MRQAPYPTFPNAWPRGFAPWNPRAPVLRSPRSVRFPPSQNAVGVPGQALVLKTSALRDRQGVDSTRAAKAVSRRVERAGFRFKDKLLLLVPQCHYGIDLRRPPGGDVAGQQRHGGLR